MQIWKCPYVLIPLKTIRWKRLILNSKNSRVIHQNILFFKEKVDFFNVFYCFCMFVNKHFANFTNKWLEISEDFIIIETQTYRYCFQIFINVPLIIVLHNVFDVTLFNNTIVHICRYCELSAGVDKNIDVIVISLE